MHWILFLLMLLLHMCNSIAWIPIAPFAPEEGRVGGSFTNWDFFSLFSLTVKCECMQMAIAVYVEKTWHKTAICKKKKKIIFPNGNIFFHYGFPEARFQFPEASYDYFYMLTFLSIRTGKHKPFDICSAYRKIWEFPSPCDELAALAWCYQRMFGVYSKYGWLFNHRSSVLLRWRQQSWI